MQRLNNRGWGMSTFIVFLVIFLLAILIVSILAYRVDKKGHIPIISEEYINIY